MPLSDHEQRLLDQMEQALYAEDPRFATQMQGAARPSHKRHVIGAVGALAGLGLVIVGISTTWIVGAVGFALMVAALAYAFAPPRAAKAALRVVRDGGGGSGATRRIPGGKRSRRAGSSGSSGSFMQRMEARWEKRRNGW
ncbi:MAG: DUF3040 domain-containing protein [Tetrasphaera sp.]